MRTTDDERLPIDLFVPGLGHLLGGRYETGFAWLLGSAFALIGSYVLLPYLLTSGLHPRLIALEASDLFLLGVLPLGQVAFASFGAAPLVLLPGLCALTRKSGQRTTDGLLKDAEWKADSALGYAGAALLVVATFVGSGLLSPRLGFAVGFAGHLVGVLLAWRVLRLRRAALGTAVAAWLAGWMGAAFPTEIHAWLAPSWRPTAIPVTDAPGASRHATLVLEDAALGGRIGYAQRFIPETATDGRMLLDYYLVPLLPSGWAAADPVPAWAALITSQEEDIRSLSALRESWKERRPQGYVLRPPFAAEMDDAFDNAAGKGLVAASGAPLVRLSEHPAADLARRGRCAVAFLLALLLLLPIEPVALAIARRGNAVRAERRMLRTG